MKIRLKHCGSEGNSNRTRFAIEPNVVRKDEHSKVCPEDMKRVIQELHLIFGMARRQLGDMLLETISCSTPALVVKTNGTDSLEFRQFRGWLALFLDEPPELQSARHKPKEMKSKAAA